jgi:hypothetical protein
MADISKRKKWKLKGTKYFKSTGQRYGVLYRIKVGVQKRTT